MQCKLRRSRDNGLEPTASEWPKRRHAPVAAAHPGARRSPIGPCGHEPPGQRSVSGCTRAAETWRRAPRASTAYLQVAPSAFRGTARKLRTVDSPVSCSPAVPFSQFSFPCSCLGSQFCVHLKVVCEDNHATPFHSSRARLCVAPIPKRVACNGAQARKRARSAAPCVLQRV